VDQYLLNSHANVHSSNRPHYCPVKGCPRSEGGKGFKRKNEMIRHGLVHDSPGYVCPFCPDREHKYPRPDNLQRYVFLYLFFLPPPNPPSTEIRANRVVQTCQGSSRGQGQRRPPTQRGARTEARGPKQRQTAPRSSALLTISPATGHRPTTSAGAGDRSSCLKSFSTLSSGSI
jgi:hypothetical protein